MQFLEKRTADRAHFDIDCTRILAANEVILSVINAAADTQLPAMTVESPVINLIPTRYAERTVPAGKVVQVLIGGGGLAANVLLQDYVVRIRMLTNLNPVVEATVRVRVIDTP